VSLPEPPVPSPDGPSDPSSPPASVVWVERVADLPDTPFPRRATPGSACFDLSCAEDARVEPGKVTFVRTGLKFRPPRGCFLEIRPRSGLSTQGVVMVNAPGTIDGDYALEVKVPLTVLFGPPRWIRRGERIAQMRLVEDLPTDFRPGEVRTEGARTGGFGSTGR
jgi:dUTP pyrophosphatase